MENRRYITLHLEADDPMELSMMTMSVQNELSMAIEFFDFQQTKNGKYMCWYRVPVSVWNDQQAANGEENT